MNEEKRRARKGRKKIEREREREGGEIRPEEKREEAHKHKCSLMLHTKVRTARPKRHKPS